MRWIALIALLLVLGGWGVYRGQKASPRVPVLSVAELDEVDTLVATLSPAKIAGQLLMPAYEKTTTEVELRHWLCDLHVGGLLYLRNDITGEEVQRIRAVQSGCNLPGVPFWIAFDGEFSLMQYRYPLGPSFPEAGELHTVAEVVREATRLAHALKQLGVDVNFAPIYDSQGNEAVIAQRAFAGDSVEAARLANTFAEAMIDSGVIPTAKHFPGHGAAVGDTHTGLRSVPGDLSELPRFASAILRRIPLIMVGHLSVQGGLWDTEGLPSTLSKKMLKDLLRNEMGFTGIVITDAMNMEAVSAIPDASLKALEAGVDIVLMPLNIDAVHQAIEDALGEERAYVDQFKASAARVIRLKMVNGVQ